jgi:hypothetical protein
VETVLVSSAGNVDEEIIEHSNIEKAVGGQEKDRTINRERIS